METLSERKIRGRHCSTAHVGGGEVKKIGGEEDEDSGCYSVKGGSKDERKRRGRHRSTLHVGVEKLKREEKKKMTAATATMLKEKAKKKEKEEEDISAQSML